jgi:hypothetical protein
MKIISMILLPLKEMDRWMTKEMEQTLAGTKLNIKYWIDDMLDTMSRKKFMTISWNRNR